MMTTFLGRSGLGQSLRTGTTIAIVVAVAGFSAGCVRVIGGGKNG